MLLPSPTQTAALSTPQIASTGRETPMNKNGQTVVELALIFPIVIFVFAVMYHLILMVRTEIELRESAFHIASRVALGQSAETSLLLEMAKLTSTNARWGILNLARSSVKEQPIPEWQ